MLGTIASSVAKSAIKPGLISAGSSAIKPGLISAGSSVTNVKQAVWGALGRHALNAVTPGLMASGATVVNDWGDPTMSGRRKAFRALGAGVAGGALGLGGAHLATKGLTKFAPKLLKGEAGHAVQAAGMGLGLGVGGLASNALIGKGTPPPGAFKSAADAVTAGATVKQAVWGKALASFGKRMVTPGLVSAGASAAKDTFDPEVSGGRMAARALGAGVLGGVLGGGVRALGSTSRAVANLSGGAGMGRLTQSALTGGAMGAGVLGARALIGKGGESPATPQAQSAQSAQQPGMAQRLQEWRQQAALVSRARHQQMQQKYQQYMQYLQQPSR